jgi:hypothetical protein
LFPFQPVDFTTSMHTSKGTPVTHIGYLREEVARHTERADKGGTASRGGGGGVAGVLSSAIPGKEATASIYQELRLLCKKKLEPHKLAFKDLT